jgi:Tat protein translocase TatC
MSRNPPEAPASRGEEEDPTARMSFFDHLAELRTRILWCVAFIGIGFIVGLYYAKPAYEFLSQPMLDALRGAGLGDRLVSTSPLGPLRLYISTGLYLGIVIASPMVLYQVWLFVAPGLYRHERRAALTFLLSSVFLFLAGTAFGYLVMMPMTLRFLVSFFVEWNFQALISITEYFDLVLVILLGLGLIFQLPILIFILSVFGIVTPRFLWNNFRYAVLVIAVVAAVITPTTDVVTMTVFMLPMIGLYLIGIGVSFAVVRKREKAALARAGVQNLLLLAIVSGLSTAFAAGCDGQGDKSGAASQQSSAAAVARPAPQPVEPALPADRTGGFDGRKAWEHVAQLVAIGPRAPGSEGSRRTQEYIRGQLKSFGCAVEEDTFEASTARGTVKMTNLVATIPGATPRIVLLLTHYDTYARPEVPNFVGANDSGSSTGVMLEMARLLCPRKSNLTVWIAFLDGEEAFKQWSDTDGTFGSRQLAAKMKLADELKRVQAVVLADMVGYKELRFERESNSTKWLTDLVWSTAARLGYAAHFVEEESAVEDDHTAFLRRDVPAVDIIQLNDYPYWHTEQDTLDKISPRSLGIVGHVLLELLPALEKKNP